VPRCLAPWLRGCEYNPNGIAKTQEMTARITEQFFGKKRPLPHKFKMSFSGCPIDCARSSEMDLGFQGAVNPGWDESACTGCRICSHACTEGAIESDAEPASRCTTRPSACFAARLYSSLPDGRLAAAGDRLGGARGREAWSPSAHRPADRAIRAQRQAAGDRGTRSGAAARAERESARCCVTRARGTISWRT